MYNWIKLFSIEVNMKIIDHNFFLPGKKKKLAMLDLLIKAEKDNLIDEDGIKEELDTFTFAVSLCSS